MPPPTSQPRKPDTAALDTEKNQYIPSFIANKPFYVPDSPSGDSVDYLTHQRLSKQADDSLANSKWYDRGKIAGKATKYRKGACENCGSMTHKAKECLSRPRKQGARWTGKDISGDQVMQDVNLGWDAKRDRWNGYDASEYQAVILEYNELEALKKKPDGDEDGEEGDKYEEETSMGRDQAKGTRNLRLREDTAKYLLNLDLESAKYDPKTRSMADVGASDDKAAALVAEDNFVRKSGDAAAFEKAQTYAWETQERGSGSKLHLQANPTEGEIMMKKQTKESDEKKAAHRKALLEKYGGEEHLKPMPLKDTLVTESERYIEYDADGLVKGAPKVKPKSKYAEDVYVQNHTSVWGSWWSEFVWGYACCHSTVKNSYCTGKAGIEAFEEAARRAVGMDLDEPEESGVKAIEAPQEKQRDTEEEAAKRKRNIDEMRDGLTEEDMDRYRRKRTNANDPMAKLLGKDELLH